MNREARKNDDATPAGAADSPHQACPMCGGMVEPDAAHEPFCSPRCRMADLGKWFDGEYMITRQIRVDDEM